MRGKSQVFMIAGMNVTSWMTKRKHKSAMIKSTEAVFLHITHGYCPLLKSRTSTLHAQSLPIPRTFQHGEHDTMSRAANEAMLWPDDMLKLARRSLKLPGIGFRVLPQRLVRRHPLPSHHVGVRDVRKRRWGCSIRVLPEQGVADVDALRVMWCPEWRLRQRSCRLSKVVSPSWPPIATSLPGGSPASRRCW